jgi:hypothetical protein
MWLNVDLATLRQFGLVAAPEDINELNHILNKFI